MQTNPITLQKVAQILQDEADGISAGATSLFAGDIRDMAVDNATNAALLQLGTDRADVTANFPDPEHAQGPPGLHHAIQEGFQHLSRVIALAVLVSEPSLLVDDLLWMQQMMESRDMRFKYPLMTDRLLQAFSQACSSLLTAPQLQVVEDLISEAKTILNERRNPSA